MFLEEVYERVLLMSGQFLLTKENVEIDVDRFKFIVESALGDWNSCRQARDIIRIARGEQYTFTEHDSKYGIPDHIVKVVPTSYLNILSSNSRWGSSFSNYGYNRRHDSRYLEIKDDFAFEYRNPTLYTHTDCEIEAHALYDHKLTPYKDSGNTRYRLDTIEPGDITFFELVRARFMIALGHQRSAFASGDLTITVNGEQLISEGLQLEERAIERLHTKDKQWYLAFGG